MPKNKDSKKQLRKWPRTRLPDHHNLRGRKQGPLRQSKRILIITEGEETEPNYFTGLKQERRLTVDIKCLGGLGSKLDLVERAIDQTNEEIDEDTYDPDIDVTWVVMDRDTDKRNRLDRAQFNQAIGRAENSNLPIRIAWSNHSFELWLLLHFDYVDTAQMQADLEKKLAKRLGIKKYDKTNPDIYQQVIGAGGDLHQAIKRAEKLLTEKAGISPVDANPSTKVHLLILELLRRNR